MSRTERHHVEGRCAPGGDYITPQYTVTLTLSQHVGVHVHLRALGLEFPAPGMDLGEYRRRRLAAHVELLAEWLRQSQEEREIWRTA